MSLLKRIRNCLTPLFLVPVFRLPLVICSDAAASEKAENYSAFVFYFENDLFGNTFRDSASVDKNYLVADISAGVSVIYKRFKLTYTQIYRTEEFQGQDGGQFFGSFNLAYTF